MARHVRTGTATAARPGWYRAAPSPPPFFFLEAAAPGCAGGRTTLTGVGPTLTAFSHRQLLRNPPPPPPLFLRPAVRDMAAVKPPAAASGDSGTMYSSSAQHADAALEKLAMLAASNAPPSAVTTLHTTLASLAGYMHSLTAGSTPAPETKGRLSSAEFRRLPRPRYVVGYDDDAAKLSRSNRSELASLIASSSATAAAGARANGMARGGLASITVSSSMGRNTSSDSRGSSSKAPSAAGKVNPAEVTTRRSISALRFGAAAKAMLLVERGNARLPVPGVTVTFTSLAGSS
nr:unnamed protein product [Digitaria exilis]